MKKERYRRAFLATRNEYKRKVNASKEKSWASLVATRGNDNPWGLVYKLGADKVKIADVLTSIRVDDRWTESIEGTVTTLMNTLVPPDAVVDEGPEHARIRMAAAGAHGEGEEPPLTMAELERAIKSTKPNKSPGPDLVPPEAVRKWVEPIKAEYLSIVNKCFEEGVFPWCWKTSDLRIIRKAGNRDWSNPKSYRPISLLPVMGKLYERMIALRLKGCLEGKLSSNQYGFMEGRSTVDAVLMLSATEYIGQSTQKYIIGLFLDIKGAFDGVWWPAVIEKLERLKVSRQVMGAIKSYLGERYMSLKAGQTRISREATKGCPQGSVLGPLLWYVVFDDFLRVGEIEGVKVIAYADDGLVLVRANSRNEIEHKFRAVTEGIERWARLVKLEFAVEKTKLMNFGKKFDRARQPRIFLHGERVEMVTSILYLGLLLDDKLQFFEHAKMVGEKAKALFAKILRIARLKYGLKHRTYMTIYDGVFIPIMTYAART